MERTPSSGRPLVLDVVLGFVVAYALNGLAAQVRTVAAIRTLSATGRLSLLVGATLFAVLYWIETTVVLRASEKDDGGDGVTSDTHPLSRAFSLLVVGLLALIVAFANLENMGWFLGATALLWLVDVVALLLLRKPAAEAGGSAALGFLLTYGSVNLLLFTALAAWNGFAPWTESFRAAVAIALLVYVLVRHVLWRPAGLVRARRA